MEHDNQPKPAQSTHFDESELLHGGEKLHETADPTETGHSSAGRQADPSRLTGSVSGAEVREALVGTMPEGPNSGRRDPLGGDLGRTPAKVDPSDARSSTGPRQLAAVFEADPSTQGPNVNEADYEMLHNDNSTPNYQDEVYRHPQEPATTSSTGDRPESWPKENDAY